MLGCDFLFLRLMFTLALPPFLSSPFFGASCPFLLPTFPSIACTSLGTEYTHLPTPLSPVFFALLLHFPEKFCLNFCPFLLPSPDWPFLLPCLRHIAWGFYFSGEQWSNSRPFNQLSLPIFPPPYSSPVKKIFRPCHHLSWYFFFPSFFFELLPLLCGPVKNLPPSSPR